MFFTISYYLLERETTMKDLSVVVPTMNEEYAPIIIRQIYAELGKDTEVIVIDKSTPKMRKPLEATGARVVVQETRGYENALMEGFRLAKGEIIASIDPDGTYAVEDLKRVVHELRNDGEFAFVAGSRLERLPKDAMTPTIRFGNWFLKSMFNILYRSKMGDVMNGIFAMKRGAFDTIRYLDAYRAGTPFFEIELVRRGFKIRSIPISYKPRSGSESKISKAKPFYGVTIAYHAIRYARDYSPLLIFGSIGVVLMIAGIVLGGLVFANYLQAGTLTEIGRALIAFMLVVVGFLSVISGLILDLLLEVEKSIVRKR